MENAVNYGMGDIMRIVWVGKWDNYQIEGSRTTEWYEMRTREIYHFA